MFSFIFRACTYTYLTMAFGFAAWSVLKSDFRAFCARTRPAFSLKICAPMSRQLGRPFTYT